MGFVSLNLFVILLIYLGSIWNQCKGTKLFNSGLCSLQIVVLVCMNLIWLLVYQFAGFVSY
jgi:hypothetical protein